MSGQITWKHFRSTAIGATDGTLVTRRTVRVEVFEDENVFAVFAFDIAKHALRVVRNQMNPKEDVYTTHIDAVHTTITTIMFKVESAFRKGTGPFALTFVANGRFKVRNAMSW